MIAGNIGEIVKDEKWLHGQIAILQEIIAKPIDRHAIVDAKHSLRDAILKQGMLKQSLSEAKTTLKTLMTTFSAEVALRALQEPQEDVIGRADKAMYQAKKTGKNRVAVAE